MNIRKVIKVKTKAAVITKLGAPLELLDLDIPELAPGQVLVEVVYSGVCHTQLLECRGYRGEDKYLPHCLGHEGSGIVLEVGKGVTKVKPGDKVILSWMQGSGMNVPGTKYLHDGEVVNSGAIITFATKSVISENRLTKLIDGVSMKDAAMIGCAVATGLGAVFNVAKASPGQSLVVFGAGGIGLCALKGAFVSGCYPIVAVDINDVKLKFAKESGASHCINSKNDDLFDELKKICPEGFDLAIESSGVPSVMSQAVSCVRDRGGVAVIIGNAHAGQVLELDPKQFNMGKRVYGTWGGDNNPDKDFLKYMRLVKSGKLDLSLLVSGEYSLSRVNDAIDDLEKGTVARPIINMKLD